MAGALENTVSAPLGSSFDSLERRTLIHHHGGNPQFVNVQTFVVLSVSDGRLKSFLEYDRRLLWAESQNVQGILNRLAAYLVSDKTCFLS
mmetsp:Transcript_103705/g.323250  ORF Transcript_103705/g.323250 Transcript_103705/m.323250 type:complete len:90 (-) Transcript_103705:269-538(-)